MNLEANVTPRYLLSVDRLRKEHDKLMSSERGEVARFETRLEDYERPLPSLFKPTDAEIRAMQEAVAERALPNILLAKAMGILTMMEDPETGLENLSTSLKMRMVCRILKIWSLLARQLRKVLTRLMSR